MIRAFVFITTRSMKNRVVSRLRRLRQPRYLISFLFGLTYLWFVGLRHFFTARHVRITPSLNLQATAIGGELLALVVLAVLVLIWALPDSGGGLKFSEAEIQFLFPAPVTRRQLLLYRIAREQPQVLISAAAMTLIGFRKSGFVGLWIAFVVMTIYFTLVGLARARLKLAGIGFLWRLVAVTLVMCGLAYLFYSELEHFNPAALKAAMKQSNSAAVGAAITRPLQTPAMSALLFVPHLFARAVLPMTKAQLAINAGALIILGIAFIEIAARLNVSFEEASIRMSQRQDSLRNRVRLQRTGQYVMFRRLPPLFRLRGDGPPELAIVWKNTIAAIRISIAWLIVLLVVITALTAQVMFTTENVIHVAAAGMALLLCAMFPFMGSAIFTHDMRLDLTRFELLKSYPISGERLVAAEIAVPLMFVSAVEIVMLCGTAVLLRLMPDPGPLDFFASPQFIVVALLFAIPICALQLLIRNAVPVLVPGWAVRSAEDVRGFAVAGQRIVMMLANLILLAVGLVPAGLIFLPLFLVGRHFVPHNQVFVLAAATAPAVALLLFEVWMGIRFLGAQFEKIDVSSEVDLVTA